MTSLTSQRNAAPALRSLRSPAPAPSVPDRAAPPAFPDFAALRARLPLAEAGLESAAALVAELEEVLAEAVAALEAATGCPDAEAEALMGKWDELDALYARAVKAAETEALEARIEAAEAASERNDACLAALEAGLLGGDGDGRQSALRAEALQRWPADPPPVEACGWFGTHRRFWRRPSGGWECETCHPPVDGLEVETWEIPELEEEVSYGD